MSFEGLSLLADIFADKWRATRNALVQEVLILLVCHDPFQALFFLTFLREVTTYEFN